MQTKNKVCFNNDFFSFLCRSIFQVKIPSFLQINSNPITTECMPISKPINLLPNMQKVDRVFNILTSKYYSIHAQLLISEDLITGLLTKKTWDTYTLNKVSLLLQLQIIEDDWLKNANFNKNQLCVGTVRSKLLDSKLVEICFQKNTHSIYHNCFFIYHSQYTRFCI